MLLAARTLQTLGIESSEAVAKGAWILSPEVESITVFPIVPNFSIKFWIQ